MPTTELLGAVGMTHENKQFYSRLLLERAKPNWVYMSYGRKDGIPRNGGNSIEFRRFERPSASTSALTEGTRPASTNLTVVNVAATVQQYGAFTFHSEVLETQSIDPWIQNVTEMYGEHMADSLDTVVRDVVVAGTTVQYASTAGARTAVASGMNLTYAEIREMVSTLRGNNARGIADGKYIGIVHPDSSADLFGDSDIVSAFENAGVRGPGNPMFTGMLDVFYGVRFVETTNAKIFTSAGLSGANVYATMICGAGAYGVTDWEAHSPQLLVKSVGSAGADDPLSQYGTIGWKAALAAVRLNESFMGRIEHNAAFGVQAA
jgi:N4-gp56 family major capsid protein